VKARKAKKKNKEKEKSESKKSGYSSKLFFKNSRDLDPRMKRPLCQRL
jgi:hypothetical protein